MNALFAFKFTPARRRLLCGLCGASTILAACAVGPDFKPPARPTAGAYTTTPLPKETAAAPGSAGEAQAFQAERDIPAEWWTQFQSPELDSLIRKAIRANPTVESARAALRQAQENVYAQQGYFFPSLQASYSPSRTKISGNTGGNSPGVQGDGSVISTVSNPPASQGGTAPFNEPVTYNWHSAQLTVGYAADVFGGNRRQVESLQAQMEAQRFELEATLITLASNVVAAAIQEASVREQIQATGRIIELNEHALQIVRHQFQVGYATGIDVAAQESSLAQARQMLPPLTRQLEQTRDLIRALVGNLPDQDVPETFTLDRLHLPTELPLSLPSRLVEQRPDIRAAEAQVHSASAQVGVAVAARLPQFAITGTFGGNASVFSQMFSASGQFFSVAGTVAQTLFDGGTLLHRKRAADEALVQAERQYRSTVLTAFENVADTLHAIAADADALSAAVQAERAAGGTLDITRQQERLGYVNVQTLLSADAAYQQAVINSVQARATRLGDTAALYQALGGGWWNRARSE